MVTHIQPPKDWALRRLGEIAPLQRGFDLPTKEIVKGEYPIVYSNGILNYHNTFQAKAPGVVTGRSGTIGKVTYVEQDYWPHNTSLWVTDFKGNDPKFIYYLYLSLGLERFSTGSGVPTLNRNDVHTFEVLIPKRREEQLAIVKALSETDTFIGLLGKLIDKKKNIKQGATQELLTGKKRLPGFKGDFITKKLDELSLISRGASPRPIDDPKWFDNDSGIGWVRISDVTKSNKYLFETTQNLSENGVKSSRLVNANNLIMSICATVGRPIITKKKVCIHDGFVVFEKPLANIEYLYYYLSSIEKRWSRHGQTGSQMNLNTKIIGNEEVPLPSTLEEQSAISGILSSMDLEIEVLERKRDKCKLLKVGLMQQLLTGRIRLKCKD